MKTPMFRVHCGRHQYDTGYTVDSEGTAVSAARMHSLLPCHDVRIFNEQRQVVDWVGRNIGPTVVNEVKEAQ